MCRACQVDRDMTRGSCSADQVKRPQGLNTTRNTLNTGNDSFGQKAVQNCRELVNVPETHNANHRLCTRLHALAQCFPVGSRLHRLGSCDGAVLQTKWAVKCFPAEIDKTLQRWLFKLQGGLGLFTWLGLGSRRVWPNTRATGPLLGCCQGPAGRLVLLPVLLLTGPAAVVGHTAATTHAGAAVDQVQL